MVGLKRTYRKVILREVRFSLSRFLAIFAIVALGVGFLAGLLATTPDMRLSVDDYYDRMNMHGRPGAVHPGAVGGGHRRHPAGRRGGAGVSPATPPTC